MTQWKIIDSGKMAPQAIMQKDADLLDGLEGTQQPILHVYDWESDCFTYGYFLNPFKYLCEEAIKTYQLKMARRPTGGGVIFHLTDFAFSVLIPATHAHFSLNTLENYAYVNQWIIQAIAPLLKGQPELLKEECCKNATHRVFCMARPTQYDIILGGKKLGGAAQRRTKHGLLHQGSLSLALPPIPLLKEVLRDHLILEAMQRNAYLLLDSNYTEGELQTMRQHIKHLLIISLEN